MLLWLLRLLQAALATSRGLGGRGATFPVAAPAASTSTAPAAVAIATAAIAMPAAATPAAVAATSGGIAAEGPLLLLPLQRDARHLEPPCALLQQVACSRGDKT